MEKRLPDKPRVFEEWDVDCEECRRYWDDTCDGVSKGSRRLCNSFVATRRVVLPAKIERLESAVRSLKLALIVLAFPTGFTFGWAITSLLELMGI